jgi:phosphoglycerol transferase
MLNIKPITLNVKSFYFLTFSLFVGILMRNSALYPTVFADEYVYSNSSRLIAIENSAISNYLFLWIYRLTNLCDDGFLSCARILNSLFFIGAIPFIYQIAKRAAYRKVAYFVCVLVIVSPINIYTAFFMPEAMYFLAFWVLAWYVLCCMQRLTLLQAFITGSLIAVCALIKPHGIFLLIPAFLFIAYLARCDRISLGKFFAFVMILGASFIFTKFSIGYLLAGKGGLSFLGGTYSATSSDFLNAVASAGGPPEALANESFGYRLRLLFSALFNFQSNFWNFIYLWFSNLKGHLLSIFLMFGLPIFICARTFLFNASKKTEQEKFRQNLIVLTLIFVGFLILFSSLYSGLMGQASGERSIWRLHERYYNFTFPLFYICAASVIYSEGRVGDNGVIKSFFRKEFGLAIFVIAMIVWGYLTILIKYQPTSIDSPELAGFVAKRSFLLIFSFVSIFLILGMVCQRNWAARIYLFLLAPATILVSSVFVNLNMWERSTPDVYDRAGIVAKQILSKADMDHLVVVGENPIELSRVMFYLSNPNVTSQTIKGGSLYEESMLPNGKTGALVFDRYAISDKFNNIRFFDGFTLIGGHQEIVVKFDLQNWPPKGISQVTGVDKYPESWGIWSVENVVRLQFVEPLPNHFKLTIEARAFGPNIGRLFQIKVGQEQRSFKLDDSFGSTTLSFYGVSNSNSLLISIPKPTAPSSLSNSQDNRTLGIALKTLKISW